MGESSGIESDSVDYVINSKLQRFALCVRYRPCRLGMIGAVRCGVDRVGVYCIGGDSGLRDGHWMGYGGNSEPNGTPDGENDERRCDFTQHRCLYIKGGWGVQSDRAGTGG